MVIERNRSEERAWFRPRYSCNLLAKDELGIPSYLKLCPKNLLYVAMPNLHRPLSHRVPPQISNSTRESAGLVADDQTRLPPTSTNKRSRLKFEKKAQEIRALGWGRHYLRQLPPLYLSYPRARIKMTRASKSLQVSRSAANSWSERRRKPF